MTRFAVAALLLLCTIRADARWNDKIPPEAYVDPIDQQIARTRVGVPGRPYPCAIETVVQGTKLIAHAPVEKCVKLQPSRHWRGLWRNEFEGSRFCPAPAKTCVHDSPGDRIWLRTERRRPSGGLYRVEFVGRRTEHRGPYGHLGGSDYELVVDRMISIKEIEAPYRPTRRDYESMKRQCRTMPGCSVEDIEKEERRRLGGGQS